MFTLGHSVVKYGLCSTYEQLDLVEVKLGVEL